MKVKKGDLVQMLAGKDRGKQGRVLDARPNEQKVLDAFHTRIDTGVDSWYDTIRLFVTAPDDVSSRLPAVLVPASCVEERSTMSTGPLELIVTLPKLAVPSATVIAPPPLVEKKALPPTLSTSLG